MLLFSIHLLIHHPASQAIHFPIYPPIHSSIFSSISHLATLLSIYSLIHLSTHPSFIHPSVYFYLLSTCPPTSYPPSIHLSLLQVHCLIYSWATSGTCRNLCCYLSEVQAQKDPGTLEYTLYPVHKGCCCSWYSSRIGYAGLSVLPSTCTCFPSVASENSENAPRAICQCQVPHHLAVTRTHTHLLA